MTTMSQQSRMSLMNTNSARFAASASSRGTASSRFEMGSESFGDSWPGL